MFGFLSSDLLAEPDTLQNPIFEKADLQRPHIGATLVSVVSGVAQPTDIQFVPGQPNLMVVLEKTGTARWFDLKNGNQGDWFKINVLTKVEEGLVGLAFHPEFKTNGRFFIDYVVSDGGQDTTHIAEWSVEPGVDLSVTKPRETKVLIRQEQPFANHKSGQLVFGADKMLYIGFGDGGSGGDPHKNGQDKTKLLGKILRIDVNQSEGEKGYQIPRDNPFPNTPNVRPEIFASGFRNPWRFTFDNRQRLIVADVGQDLFEEVDVVESGGDYGWNIFEGNHCFLDNPLCETVKAKHKFPVIEYSHDEGAITAGEKSSAIIGGVVSPLDSKNVALRGLYLFAEFANGKIWAAKLPDDSQKLLPTTGYFSLGKWPISPTTFGRDASGQVYVADTGKGVIYRITTP